MMSGQNDDDDDDDDDCDDCDDDDDGDDDDDDEKAHCETTSHIHQRLQNSKNSGRHDVVARILKRAHNIPQCLTESWLTHSQ